MSYSFGEFNTHKMYSNYGVTSFKSSQASISGVQTQTPVDTFESKDKTSFTGKTKRNVLIASGGALAVVSVAFLLGRRMSLEKAQKIFQKTFMNNDISLEDTSKIIAEFKEISKIEDISEYINALFESAQKHYGLGHLKTKLEINDLPPNKLGAMDAANTLTISKNAKREKIVEIIFHEFRHAKQNDIMGKIDLDRFVKGIINRKSTDKVLEKTDAFKQLMESADRSGNLSEADLKEVVLATLKERLGKSNFDMFEELGYGAGELPKVANINEYAEKCFKAHTNYNDGNIFAYSFNFLEKDARGAASGICNVFKNLGKL